jgi:hypothetical protein
MSDVVVLDPVQGVLMQGELTEKEVVKRRKAIQGALDMSKKYLLELKEQDNWKKDPIVKQNNISTMEQYWNVAFGYSKQHGYRLIQEQEVRESIEDESLQPENEGQARVLATIPAAYREKVMRKAYDIAPEPANKKLPKKISAKVIEQAMSVVKAEYPEEFPETVIVPVKTETTKAHTNGTGSGVLSAKEEEREGADYIMDDEVYKNTPKLLDVVLVKSRKDLFAFKFRYPGGDVGYEYFRSSVKGLFKPSVDTAVPNTMTRAESFVKDAEMTLSESDFAADKKADAGIFDKDETEEDPLAEVVS